MTHCYTLVMPRYKREEAEPAPENANSCPYERGVREATERLYEVFCRYRFTDMDGDLAFPGSCDPKPLLAQPLRQLGPDAFERFAWKAVTTWGSADDLRHFLPRMLELTTYGDVDLLERWIVFKKISYAKWRSWPQREQAALKSYFHAVFSHCIHRPASDYQGSKSDWHPCFTIFSKDGRFSDPVTGFLCDLIDVDEDLIPSLLSEWTNQLDELSPLLALAFVYLDKHYADTGLYGDWLRSASHVERLAAAWEKYQDDPALCTILSDAHASAERFANYRGRKSD